MNNLTDFSIDDLVQYPVKDLSNLYIKVGKAIDLRKKKEGEQLIKEFQSRAAESGFSLNELLGEQPKPKKEAAKPKYRNPDNYEQTWGGNGRKPRWLLDLVSSGMPMEDLEIK